MRSALFVLAIFGLLLFLGSTALGTLRRRRAAASHSLPSLLDRLQPLNRDVVEQLAREPAPGTKPPVRADEIWTLLGGMRGLDALEQNCAVLIELASHLQERYPEALVLAENLRLNTRQIQWHVGRLRSAQHTGHVRSAFPDYAQQAVRLYHAMTTELLTTYEALDPRGFAEIQLAF